MQQHLFTPQIFTFHFLHLHLPLPPLPPLPAPAPAPAPAPPEVQFPPKTNSLVFFPFFLPHLARMEKYGTWRVIPPFHLNSFASMRSHPVSCLLSLGCLDPNSPLLATQGLLLLLSFPLLMAVTEFTRSCSCSGSEDAGVGRTSCAAGIEELRFGTTAGRGQAAAHRHCLSLAHPLWHPRITCMTGSSPHFCHFWSSQ